jgi:hypothetical protein
MFRAPRANWLTALGLNFSMRSGRMRQIKQRWPRSKGRLIRPGTPGPHYYMMTLTTTNLSMSCLRGRGGRWPC